MKESEYYSFSQSCKKIMKSEWYISHNEDVIVINIQSNQILTKM